MRKRENAEHKRRHICEQALEHIPMSLDWFYSCLLDTPSFIFLS